MDLLYPEPKPSDSTDSITKSTIYFKNMIIFKSMEDISHVCLSNVLRSDSIVVFSINKKRPNHARNVAILFKINMQSESMIVCPRIVSHSCLNDHGLNQVSMLGHTEWPTLKPIITRLIYKKIGSTHNNHHLRVVVSHMLHRDDSLVFAQDCLTIDVLKLQESKNKVFV